jgi:DNA polymerase I-like protein with 3'-5' exonuclease and polymerase domains
VDSHAAHFKSIGAKRLKKGELENPCVGLKPEKVQVPATLWGKPLPFKLSLVGLKRYQQALKHKPVMVKDRATGIIKTSFDVNAIRKLVTTYPKDPIYPLIEEQRYLSKLRGTYVGVRQPDLTVKGGMPMGKDGRGHPRFNFNPETLRLACPFFHTLPRPGKPDEPHTGIRNMIIPDEGDILLARDFSGIEAVLVGYEAGDPDYLRLARRDVHSFYTAYALHQLDPGMMPANDLPLLSWDDDRLFRRLDEVKSAFKKERNGLYKHLVHAINFGQGPEGARKKILLETLVNHPTSLIGKVMGVYKELFPKIPAWQVKVRLQAEKDGFLRNAFGYVLRFNRVFKYEYVNGEWDKTPGDDAEAVLAFLPQSTAAGMIKEAMLRLYFNRFEEAGQFLRLQVHDEIFCQCPIGYADTLDDILMEEMERPVPELALPEHYGMGPYLSVLSESKRGYRWGQMK